MLFEPDILIRELGAERHRQLLAEAETSRMLRQARQSAPGPDRLRDRLLHGAGALLVRWGTHLQARSRKTPDGAPGLGATFVETRLV